METIDQPDMVTDVTTIADTPVESPVENHMESPAENHVYTSMELPVENHMESLVETSVNKSVENAVENPVETPVRDPLVIPVEMPVENRVEILAETPVKNPVETPVLTVAEDEEPKNSFLSPECTYSFQTFTTSQHGTIISNGIVEKPALVRLWSVFILTMLFCILLLVSTHMTNSLTLRVEAYHSIYNSMVLGGCLFTIHVCRGPMGMKNTFGWTRVEPLSGLSTLVFLLSLCFSVAVESLQTAAQVGHQEKMQHSMVVLALGAIGLILNVIVFYLIGGYSYHQGRFLHKWSSGIWIRDEVPSSTVETRMQAIAVREQSKIEDSNDSMENITEDGISGDGSHKEVSARKGMVDRNNEQSVKWYKNVNEIIRDVSGLLMVMLCALLVYWDETQGKHLVVYIDPAFALLSSFVLLYLSYSHGKECCSILLQTIPGHINVHTFSAKLLQKFPEVVNVHHLHIWSLTPGKVIATAHVVFSNPKVYQDSSKALKDYFYQKDITQVTLQPEFVNLTGSSASSVIGSTDCFLRCEENLCGEKECCQEEEQLKDVVSLKDEAGRDNMAFEVSENVENSDDLLNSAKEPSSIITPKTSMGQTSE